MQKIYLICGVSGSGKSHVCRQLTDKFTYIPHDLHYHDHARVLHKSAKESSKPVITECPFGERILRDDLERLGLTVVPFFVIEPPYIVAARYEAREKKPLPKNALTRATTIKKRADEWKAKRGTSKEMLEILKKEIL